MSLEGSSDQVERYPAVSVGRHLGYDSTRAALVPNATRHTELIQIEVRGSELPKQVREDSMIEESCSDLIATRLRTGKRPQGRSKMACAGPS
jgi:hypothetical protein